VSSFFGPNEATDLADDARRLLAELDREVPGVAALNSECRPSLDVFETQSGTEVVVDIPGVNPDSIRVAIKRDTLLVVGAKAAPAGATAQRYHLAERSYGRFARAVRLHGAIDTRHASARAANGELRIVLPRLDDRRGTVMMVPVDTA
jgi:HSP20 family protein